MGQAKLRGTYEQRKEAAIHKETLFAEDCHKALRGAMPAITVPMLPQPRNSPRMSRILLATFATLSMMK